MAWPVATDPLAQSTPHLRDRLQRPLRDLRLSVIDACNFRCPYCMPADKVGDDHGLDATSRLDFDEIETLVRGFVRLGVRKLRLTGGEPLLRKRLPELIARLARIDGLDDLALTTNGTLLATQAQALHDAGLQRLTISLDALEPSLYRQLSGGRGNVGNALAGIAAAEAAGFTSIKLNCVVQRDVNDGEILGLVERVRGTGHELRFIEYMDVGTCNGWSASRVLPSADIRDRVHARWPIAPVAANYTGEVATRYRFDDACGEIGFVSSVTAPFCGDCHRARVSADGKLYTCLFAGEGTDLRAVLREGELALADRVAGIWSLRGDRYSEMRSTRPSSGKRVEMFLVGG
jgi:cyclic pyranopterin phosphate synthase